MDTSKLIEQTRGAVQDSAYTAWDRGGRKGTIVMATGVGKSKIAVSRVAMLYAKNKSVKVLLVVPTITLRDENWPAEFKRWKVLKIMNACVKRICYASLKHEKGNDYDLVIYDEIHRLTQMNSEGVIDGTVTAGLGLQVFAGQNRIKEAMGLTATEPDRKMEPVKFSLMNNLAPVCYRYSLDQAVADGVVADYEIRVIMSPLEQVLRDVPAGNKEKPFMQTEAQAYIWLNSQANKFMAMARGNPKLKKTAEYKILARMHFVNNLNSKTKLAEKVIKKVHTPGKRTLVFCGTIEQSRKLLGENVYNSSEDRKLDKFTAFKEKKLDILGVVNAIDEGHNIPDLDQEIIAKVGSSERVMTQRVGRSIRFRPGHKGIIYIIVAQGTVEEAWLKKAIDGFDESKVFYEHARAYG